MTTTARAPGLVGIALLALGALLATLPLVFEIPLFAYLSVALLLIGGIACVPGGVGLVLAVVPEPRRALALLAVERARHQRASATIAVAGVVASLALSVALTVMVASFRDAVTRWIDVVVPADLYVRAAVGPVGGDVATLPERLPEAARAIAGVVRVEPQRVVSISLDPRRPSTALLARAVGDPATSLPLTGDLVPAPAGAIAAYVSEAVADLYGATPGTTPTWPLPDETIGAASCAASGRDDARQYGAIVIDRGDWLRLGGDRRINDIALWLAPGASTAQVEDQLRRLAAAHGFDASLLELLRRARSGPRRCASSTAASPSPTGCRRWRSRSACSASPRASRRRWSRARRKEFGLLAHLGLTRRQILAVVATEGAVWTRVGAGLGLVLGIAVSVVLVKVVNPQSFHWTMELLLPEVRLAALCAAVVAAGTVTAFFAARRAVGAQSVLAVKEDW